MLFIKKGERYGVAISLVLALVIVIILSMRIHLQSSQSIGKSNEIYNKIKLILQDWSDRYEENAIKLTLSENAEMIIISFPKLD